MIVVSDPVRQALAERRPVVAMESTIYSTLGLPVPHNAEALRRCKAAVEIGGAVPAVTAVLDGQWRVGLSEQEEERVLLGISDGLLRLSVGLEDVLDLSEDLVQALDRAAAPRMCARCPARPRGTGAWQARSAARR